MRSSFTSRISLMIGLCAVGTVTGCNLLERKPIRDTLSLEQQAREISRTVPLGTRRDTAIKRLNDAGIVGEFATRFQTVYHCELWNRPNGERYHLNVALLFDETGRLREIRESDAALLPDANAGSSIPAGRSSSIRSAGAVNRALPVSQPDRTPNREFRTGARAPFANEK